MALYAEVAVEAARGIARESYTYTVPDGMDVVPGHRVTVPFGRRSTYGFVVSLGTEEPAVETKPIATAGAEPLLLPHQIALARLVADHYWVPMIEVLRAMLPPRVRSSGSAGSAPSGRQTRHTRLLFFSHVLSPTGMVLPARDVCQQARGRGIVTVIDGAHAPAMIPLAVESLGRMGRSEAPVDRREPASSAASGCRH